jgi:hypothetical protein
MRTTIDRRTFLGTAAGAGAIGWLSHYFGLAFAGDDPKVAAMGNVTDAYRRASSLGKPLLVLVIPAGKAGRFTRGEIFGALLNHGGRGAYLDLALCEIACATVADAKLQLPGLKVEGEPLMLLVETDCATPRSTPVDPQIRYDISSKDGDKEDELVKARLEQVVASLRAAVAPDAKALASRAALAESRLPADEVKAIHAAVADGKTPQPQALERAPAIVRARAEDPVAGRQEILDALAAATEKRVTGPPPAGAKWAHSGGCGIRFEGEASGVACGMGYTPELSQRFLWFFTQ